MHNCATIGAGNLLCWGGNESNQTDVPANINNIVISYALGFKHTCAISEVKFMIKCWGSDEYDALKMPHKKITL